MFYHGKHAKPMIDFKKLMNAVYMALGEMAFLLVIFAAWMYGG